MSIRNFDRPYNRQVVTTPMAASPTKGPHFFEPIPADWHTDPDYHDPKDDLFHIVDSKSAGEVLAIVVRVAGGFDETQSNARLFASSWRLLAALKQAERVMTDADLDHEPSDDPGRVALEAVRAAIAEAEGR